METVKNQQRSEKSLTHCRSLAEQNKVGYLMKDGILYKCSKLFSLKLTVRAIVIALKLQTKVNDLTSASEMVFKFIELHYVG